MNENDLPRTSITFADGLIPDIFDGNKNATVRYGDFGRVQAGDQLTAVDTDGLGFARLAVECTATGPVVFITKILRDESVAYPTAEAVTLCQRLNEYYDEPIVPDTTVTVLIFDLV